MVNEEPQVPFTLTDEQVMRRAKKGGYQTILRTLIGSYNRRPVLED